MKRPLFLFSISLSLGITYSYFLHSLLYIVLSIAFIISFLLLLKNSDYIKIYVIMGVILFYSVGAFEYLIISDQNEKKYLDYSDKYVTIRGYSVAEPEIKDGRVSYIIKTEEISENGIKKLLEGKILISSLMNSEASIIEYGQGVEISGQLKIPKERRNPGGFDYRRYLAGKGISATMFARQHNIGLSGISHSNPVLRAGLMIRNRVINVVNASLPEEQAGLLNGMLIGYRGGLSKDEQNAFSDAGLTHIMAVSGANIAYIVFPLAFLFKKLRIRQSKANIFIILILLVFICVTGFSPSVSRAVIMAVIVLLGQIIKRETDVFTSIALAAMILMLHNPFVLFDIGFQLSFAATVSLILFYKPIKEKLDFKYVPGFLAELFAITLAAQIGVIPLTVFHFNKISVISFISNLFAVPLTGLITIIGFTMAISGQISTVLSEVLGFVNTALLTFILYITRISSELPYAVLKIVTPNIMLIILYYLIILFFLWYKPKYKADFKIKPKYIFLGCLFILCIITVHKLIPDKLEVVFVDVGQGDCTFVKTSSGKTALIDGGGSSTAATDGSNVGETVVIPFLLDYGVSNIDTVIATHGHDDHIQGLYPVLEEMKVGKLIIPGLEDQSELEKLIDLAKRKGIQVYRRVKGDAIKLDRDTVFNVLHPVSGFKIDKSYSNNSSLVLKLLYKQVSMLMVGDIEKETEEFLLSNNMDLNADVLKVAHHGSPNSTTEDFLDSVKPSAAVISVGKNNFGHPAETVLKRLEDNHVRLYRTDKNGAVVLESDGKGISIKKTIGDK